MLEECSELSWAAQQQVLLFARQRLVRVNSFVKDLKIDGEGWS